MSDFNIYDDLELLHAEQKQKEGEELQWKEKYNAALETIQKLQVEKKELNKKVKQLEINFATLLDTARTEIKRKDNQINQLRKEKDDICFRRNVRPIRKHSIDENVSEDGKSDCGYVNPFSLSKPVDEKNKASTSRQRNGEYEEKDKISSYREARSESALGRDRDRDRSRHSSREEHRRKDNRESDQRRDRYDRTSSRARSSDSSRETSDKGQSSHTYRPGYPKDRNQTKSTNGYSSSSRYENYSKGKRYTCTERNTSKQKETANGRYEKVPQNEKLPSEKNTANRKSSALEKEILNDVKELKKAKRSVIENEAETQKDAVKAVTDKSNNFLDALFDDMVLNGEEEQINHRHNDLPPETVTSDKIEPKVVSPKTDENCNVQPAMQTPLKQPFSALLDDLFGPSPAKSAAVGGTISSSPLGESSDAVSSDEVEFVSIACKTKEKDETKKSVVVSNVAIDVSSAKCSKTDKPITNEVKIKNLPHPVSEPKAFRFIELDSSFYSSDDEDDEKTSNAIDTRESQSDIDSPPFEKCQLLRSDFKSKEQPSEAKEMMTETLLPFEMTSVNGSCRKESILTTPDDVKGDKCSKPPSLENPPKAEIACDSTAKNEKRKASPHKDTHRHRHSSKHAKSSYSGRSSNDKHRHRSERLRRDEGKHHRRHQSSKESTTSVRTYHQNEKRTNPSKEKNLKESVWNSKDTKDRTPAQEKQPPVHEDTSSDLKLYHDQEIALHCDEISDEDGVEADPPKVPVAVSKDTVPRTLEDLVISLQCEDLSDEDEVQFVVETNNEVAKDGERETGSDNFVATPSDSLNCKEGETIDSNNMVLNTDEAQSSVNNGQPTADMSQPVESTDENRKEASSNPVCPQIESENSPPKPKNALPLVLCHEQPSSQDSTDLFPSGGRRKKLKTPRKNTNAATDLLPHRWTKSDDEYGLAVTKQADALSLHPRRRQSTSNLEEAAASSCKERILPEVDATVLHKTCPIVEEELQKDMSPLWVEEESTEATIELKVVTAITSEEQSETVLETKKREDISEIDSSGIKKRNREDDDEALVTTNDVPSVGEPEVSFAVFAGDSAKPTESIVIPDSVVESDGTHHVKEDGSSLIDPDRSLPNAPFEVIDCDAKNEFVQKSIDLDVNDNQKGLQESIATGDVDGFNSPIDEKQVAASGDSRELKEDTATGCDEEPVVSDDNKTTNDNRKDVAKRGRKNKLMKDDEKSSLAALGTPGGQPVPTSDNGGNVLARCVVKLPILPIFSCFDAKNSDSPLTVHQEVAASDGNRKVNSKLPQDATLSNEEQHKLPLFDVKNSESSLIDTDGKPNSEDLQHSTHSDGNSSPPTSTESSKLVGGQSKAAQTAEQNVPTSDIPINADEKPSKLQDSFDHLIAEQEVTTSGTVLPNDEKKISPAQLKCDKMAASPSEVDVNDSTAETVTTSDEKSSNKPSLTQNPPDLDSVSENNKKNSPNAPSVISLDSAILQPVATTTHIKKYKKRILNSFNNSKIAAEESDKQHSTGSETETPVTSSSKRKRAKAQDSSDSAGDATIEGVKSTDVESGHKTKQRKKNVQTEELPTATSENSPKQKHERTHTDSGKEHPAAVVASDANKVDKTSVERSPGCNAVPADAHPMEQQTSVAKRKYKKRSSLDSPTVVATSDGAPIEPPAITSAVPSSEDIQNHIPMKSSQQPIPNEPQDVANCPSNSNALSSKESQVHDDRESNAIYIKRKMKASKHPKKRRKCSTSSSDTINTTSDSQSMIVSDAQPSPTATENRQLSVPTPAVTPTHHKIFNQDVYPEDQPPPEYNANGDDIQYQEIDNRMRSIFQSPTYSQIIADPSLNTTCVELHVDISKGDITIDETLHPGESSQCDTSSSSRKISVGSNDYVIETVGAHTANVFVTRKKCKKRTKAVKSAVP